MAYIGTGLALCIASQCTNHTGLALCIDTSLKKLKYAGTEARRASRHVLGPKIGEGAVPLFWGGCWVPT